MGEDLAYWDSMEEFFSHFYPGGRHGLEGICGKGTFEYLPKDEWRQYYVYQKSMKKPGSPRDFQHLLKSLRFIWNA